VSALRWFESNQSGIETAMGWNKYEAVGRFESNQSGIETCSIKNEKVQLLGLNRTRVELKHAQGRTAPGRVVTFESNQSGIETSLVPNFVFFHCMFESNQSGIETLFKVTLWRLVAVV